MSSHSHGGDPVLYNKAFSIGVALNVGYATAEAIFGYLYGSLALIADAGHNFGDVLGLLLAWGASVLARRPPGPRWTYGFRKMTALAALLNAILLLLAVGGILWEAIQRFSRPEPVDGWVVIAVAAVGVVINGITAWLFLGAHAHDTNIRGAFLHMVADASVSAGVVIGGIGILLTNWLWLDPVLSILIVITVAVFTLGLLHEAVDLVLDAAPHRIEPVAVREYLLALPGITSIHELHIWGVSTTEIAMTAHLIKPDGLLDDDLLRRIIREVHERFDIDYVTIQFEKVGVGNIED